MFYRSPGHVGRGLVRPDTGTGFAVVDQDGGRRRGQQGFDHGEGAVARLLGGLFLRYVVVDPEDADHRAAVVAKRHLGGVDPVALAVGLQLLFYDVVLGTVGSHDRSVVVAVGVALLAQPGEVVVALAPDQFGLVQPSSAGEHEVAPQVDAVAVFPKDELRDGVDDLRQHVAPHPQLLLDPHAYAQLHLQLLVGQMQFLGPLPDPQFQLLLGASQLLLGLQLPAPAQEDQPGQGEGDHHEQRYQRQGLERLALPARQVVVG